MSSVRLKVLCENIQLVLNMMLIVRQKWNTLLSNLRPHIPELGSTLVSFDLIHPNEKGCDYWGRHIAEAILDEWERCL
ncbi:LOW QUALITY PROTEIN: hypothetical protein ACHAWF_015570 [Thalassiosira exigua]